jgi:hypothetical protein
MTDERKRMTPQELDRWQEAHWEWGQQVAEMEREDRRRMRMWVVVGIAAAVAWGAVGWLIWEIVK